MNKIFNLVIISALVFGFANSANADGYFRNIKPVRFTQSDSSEGVTNAFPFRKICNRGRTVCY